MQLANARLYLVVDARPRVVEDALRGGVEIVQLRAKDTPDDELLEVASDFRRLCSRHDALFIVNDSAGLAARVGADGVHVGQDDMSVEEARTIVGPGRIVGLSTHSPEQITAARADYIGVGPVYETPTKPGREGVGLELVREAVRSSPVPWFAIGGIDSSNVHHVLSAGAERIAVARAIANATDPQTAARELRDCLNPRHA